MKRFVNRHPILRKALGVPLALRHRLVDWQLHSGREVLKRVSEMVPGSIVCEVKEFDGVFSIDSRSHLLHRLLIFGNYEPRISGLYKAHIQPDGDILDIGANVGFFTVAGAKRLTTGRLLAAEPTSEAFRLLGENVVRNGVSERVILYKGMIGAAKGEGQIFSIAGREEYSSVSTPLNQAVESEDVRAETVPIERVDDLADQHGLRPVLLKVDVEGAEYSVFSGAQQTLSKFRPVVISELWRAANSGNGHSGEEVVRMFKALDYVVMDSHDRLAKPGQAEVGEIICIPKERYDPAKLGF